MQAVIVYESMFGNTRAIAGAIGAGLAATLDVAVVPVARADPAQISEADCGVREWLPSLANRRGHGLAAAFDTRMQGPPVFTGRASKGISKVLRRDGYELFAEPQSFLVTKQNKLRDGELERARAWGAALTSSLSLT